MSNAKRRIAEDIAKAEPLMPPGGGAGGTGSGGQPPPQPPEYLTKQFSVRADGVYRAGQGDKPELWVCGRLVPLAETTDEDGIFGILWSWTDRDGESREEVFDRDKFAGEAGDMRGAMAARGLTFNASREGRQAFAEYVNLASSPERRHVVHSTGWHPIGGRRIYVLPDQTFGRPVRPIVFQTLSREPNLFQQAGTLAEWIGSIGEACIGNSRLCLSVSMPFAAPLLFLVGEDGGGVNLFGKAQSGKTTCGRASASVCGGDLAAGGAKALVRTWRTTANSTEAIAALHSDIGLVMDELGQSEGRHIGDCQYMLSGGQGKARLDRAAGLRGMVRFRSFYLSTGEVTLAEKMAESGVKVKAGQGVRLVDVPVDEGRGMGAFADIKDAENAGAFAQSITEATSRYFGTPFRTFIAALVARLDRDPGFVDYLRAEMMRIMAGLLEPIGAHDGQVRSVARRFALIALGGNLATDLCCTGWGIGSTGQREAEWAAQTCFFAWLKARGTTGSHEDAQAVLQLRAFVSEHGGSKFDDWGEARLAEGEQPDPSAPPPMQKFRTVNRAGWRRWMKPARPDDDQGAGCWHYFFSADGMRAALIGLEFKSALKVLVARGMIIPGSDGVISKSLRVPAHGRVRVYEVPSSVISATLGGDADPDA
jgi:uncharacterized protein (DUF927 family)